MFKRDDVKEFLTKIVENTKKEEIEEAKESINKFKSYLELTTMCDEKTISNIEEVSLCLEELIMIKEKTGSCNIDLVFDKEKKTTKKEKVKKLEDPYEKKHTNRYVNLDSDTSYTGCGSSRSSSGYSGCGSSYDSSSYSGCGSSYSNVGSRC